MGGISSFFGCFSQKNKIKVEIFQINRKRTKGEILDKNCAKTPYNTSTIFTKCNIFYARHIVFILLFLSKIRTKGEISDIIWANNPYNTATIFTKCNVFYARHMAKTWVFTHKFKKNKRWDFWRKLSKNPIWQSDNFHIMERFFMGGTSSFFGCFSSKNRKS